MGIGGFGVVFGHRRRPCDLGYRSRCLGVGFVHSRRRVGDQQQGIGLLRPIGVRLAPQQVEMATKGGQVGAAPLDRDPGLHRRESKEFGLSSIGEHQCVDPSGTLGSAQCGHHLAGTAQLDSLRLCTTVVFCRKEKKTYRNINWKKQKQKINYSWHENSVYLLLLMGRSSSVEQ